MDIQTLYQKTILFAAEKHKTQKVPGTDLTYIVHLSDVAMEILIASKTTAGMYREKAVAKMKEEASKNLNWEFHFLNSYKK